MNQPGAETPLQAKAGPRVVRNRELTAHPSRPRMRTRWVFEPRSEGWDEFVLSEWELTRAGWSDFHPHTETNVVLEGELRVACDGETVAARMGDTVTVPAGKVGRYWAPEYARMLAIYGPNPEAADTELLGYWEI